MALAPVPSDEKITELYASGQLVAELAKHHERDEDGDNVFASRCAVLHNEKKIDLFAVADSDEFAALGKHDFFTAQNAYIGAIPDLVAERRPIMELCQHLITRAGADGVAYRPNEAIRAWFVKNPHEATLAVEDAVRGDKLTEKFMTFALLAGDMKSKALEIAKAFDDERRLSAITSLSGMSYADKYEATRMASSLLGYLNVSYPDLTRANALGAVFRIITKRSDPALVSTIINAAVLEPGDQLLYTLSQILWINAGDLRPEDKAAILQALRKVDPKFKGTMGQIDHSISQMLSSPDERLALDFLRDFLIGSEMSIEQFQSIEHKLRNEGSERLFRLMLEWLLTGKKTLCDSLSRLIIEDGPLPNTFTEEDGKLEAHQIIFIFRKALGWLFIKPVACCSVLVWALRSGIKEVQSAAVDHLFDIILVSYGGDATDYLKTIDPNDSAHPFVADALAKQAAYHDGLATGDKIRELQPSDFQKAIRDKKQNDEMAEAHKEAQKSPSSRTSSRGKSFCMGTARGPTSTVLMGSTKA